ncbi:hypothetical protein [Cryobacterium sp. PH29-G1]|uniref:hypothetical protein n=1 Tax=Cryobacterium sp. PH29-G1 TaxID=3046211 RepID=UPI0024BB6E61|nr:hypothetical protein [Cryobacterium sp. PH29-G1]MDJ0350560.1 hypothetical protein [Cryobacterium sp. PH29-G1]
MERFMVKLFPPNTRTEFIDLVCAGMSIDRATRRVVASVPLSSFISLLALAALLFAVFTFHSEATGHAMHTPASAASAVAGQEAVVMGMVAVVAAPVVASISSGGLEGMLDCALLVMTCVLLLTLVALCS